MAITSLEGVIRDISVPNPSPEEKAADLLKDHLNDDQRESFVTRGYFDVVSQKGGLFRVCAGTINNILHHRLTLSGPLLSLLDDVKPDEISPYDEFYVGCLVPMVNLGTNLPWPLGDHLVFQKMVLEAREDLFWSLAHKHTHRGRRIGSVSEWTSQSAKYRKLWQLRQDNLKRLGLAPLDSG